jgi:dimethylhistidine N-methyltransferase
MKEPVPGDRTDSRVRECAGSAARGGVATAAEEGVAWAGAAGAAGRGATGPALGRAVTATPDARFAEDVRSGLTATPKALPCVYFYDARGSRLFEKITSLPEYYLTRAESEIINEHASEIAEMAPDPVQVVELGSGTSEKTVALLEALLGVNERVIYLPVDVCGDVLSRSAEWLGETIPELEIRPVRARYRRGLQHINGDEGKVLLVWLGSSIGNLGREEAASFLSCLSGQLATGDRMLIGIDLVKDPAMLEAAYSDAAGVTAAFNLNLLTRINRELGGRFDLDGFRHVAVWNADEGRIEMYIESLASQTVYVDGLGLSVAFAAGERIHTENSHKYSPEQIEALAARAGLAIEEQWLDSKELFSLNILRVGDRV